MPIAAGAEWSYDHSAVGCALDKTAPKVYYNYIKMIGIKIMANQFSRSEIIFGSESMEKLKSARVAVFGVGGVGGFTVEALARTGIGTLDIFDNDTVALTNLNRQIIALHSTIGKNKVDVFAERIHDINPDCKVNAKAMFFMPENANEVDFAAYDYVVDAIDTVTAKIEIILRCQEAGVPVISSMGAGNKVNPTMLEVSDIYKTSVCPLARVMRYELKRRGVKKCKVVFSKEPAVTPKGEIDEECNKRVIPGSNAFVPSAAGLIIASEVVKDLCGYKA